jgi:hypothetical protein
MISYSNSLTVRYKQGWIYSSTINGTDIIKYQVDKYAYVQYAKSFRAAQIIITKQLKGS